jgi:hypothetical protein
MAKDKGRGRHGPGKVESSRQASIAEMEDTDPMTREELLEAFGRSGPEPGMGAPDADERQQQPQPAEHRAM